MLRSVGGGWGSLRRAPPRSTLQIGSGAFRGHCLSLPTGPQPQASAPRPQLQASEPQASAPGLSSKLQRPSLSPKPQASAPGHSSRRQPPASTPNLSPRQQPSRPSLSPRPQPSSLSLSPRRPGPKAANSRPQPSSLSLSPRPQPSRLVTFAFQAFSQIPWEFHRVSSGFLGFSSFSRLFAKYAKSGKNL